MALYVLENVLWVFGHGDKQFKEMANLILMFADGNIETLIDLAILMHETPSNARNQLCESTKVRVQRGAMTLTTPNGKTQIRVSLQANEQYIIEVSFKPPGSSERADKVEYAFIRCGMQAYEKDTAK